jgi:hypothetical protein
MLTKVFFWLLFDKDLNCACPLQGANWDSINNLEKENIVMVGAKLWIF